MEIIDGQNGRTENNNLNTAGQSKLICYRFYDRVIYCDQDQKSIGWSCYPDEEIGLLWGHCELDENDTLVLSSCKVRDVGEVSLEEFQKWLASLPKWDRSRRVAILNMIGPGVLYERKSEEPAAGSRDSPESSVGLPAGESR